MTDAFEQQSFLLLHACYLGGWSWKPVADLLRSAGHRVLAPSLDGCGERSGQVRLGIDTESHAAEMAELLRYEDLRDVVLVATSTGGMVAAKVAETVPERISRLIFIDAVVLDDGQRLADVVNSPPMANEGDVVSGPSEEQLRGRTFASLEPELREWVIERVTLHPTMVTQQPVKLPTFFDLPWQAKVIWCNQSTNPGLEHQRDVAARLGAEWREMDAGHYPFLSAPSELVGLILE